MSKMTQKEAVFVAITNICGVHDGAYTPTKEQRAQVNMVLFQGFRSEKIELERQFDDAELKSYVSGLQSNWLRKDKRLNGGTAYIAKNPGSRTGSIDPQIKAMRTLQSTLTTEADIAEVQVHIDARLAEMKPKKVIDLSALPEELRTKFSK
jgi:hypothetical protein